MYEERYNLSVNGFGLRLRVIRAGDRLIYIRSPFLNFAFCHAHDDESIHPQTN